MDSVVALCQVIVAYCSVDVHLSHDVVGYAFQQGAARYLFVRAVPEVRCVVEEVVVFGVPYHLAPYGYSELCVHVKLE